MLDLSAFEVMELIQFEETGGGAGDGPGAQKNRVPFVRSGPSNVTSVRYRVPRHRRMDTLSARNVVAGAASHQLVVESVLSESRRGQQDIVNHEEEAQDAHPHQDAGDEVVGIVDAEGTKHKERHIAQETKHIKYASSNQPLVRHQKQDEVQVF